MVVAAIAIVDVGALGLDAGEVGKIGDYRAQGVAIERVAVQGLGVEHELAAPGRGDRGDDGKPCSGGVRALPLPMHSTSGACHE